MISLRRCLLEVRRKNAIKIIDDAETVAVIVKEAKILRDALTKKYGHT